LQSAGHKVLQVTQKFHLLYSGLKPSVSELRVQYANICSPIFFMLIYLSYCDK
jgi:hypothetical protein